RKGIYSAMVFNEFGCGTPSDPIQILINSVEPTNGDQGYTLVAEQRNQEIVATLRGPEFPQTATATITAVDGRTLHSFVWPLQGSGPNHRSIPTEGMASGRYFLTVQVGHTVLTQPFVVER
ncbi:MAG: hypothetical protein UZ07_CHB004001448, partial [Chlorobi bacterium OLB7]